jgi:C-terminal processing protease CtpA/Prc
VEPVDDKKLITDAISTAWSPASIRTPSISNKKAYKEFKEGTAGKFVGVGVEITARRWLSQSRTRRSKARPPSVLASRPMASITKV